MILFFIRASVQQIHIFMTCEKINFIFDVAQELIKSYKIHIFFFRDTDIVMDSFF